MHRRPDELDRLIRDYADEVVAPADFAELERRLTDEPTARQRLLREMNLRGTLADLALTAGERDLTVSQPPIPRSRWRVSPSWAAVLSVVAMAVAAFAATSWQRDGHVATITGIDGPLQWTGDGGRVTPDLTEGQRLPGGTLETLSADAWVELTFHDGSVATLSGYSSLTFADDGRKELHLRRGNLSVDAARQPPGRPMMVHTPTADLEVVGTQFNLDAGPTATTLAVNEGRVRATRLADSRVADVRAGQQVVAAASRDTAFTPSVRRRPVNIWHSELPHGIGYGQWDAAAGAAKAVPLLWRRCERNEQQVMLLQIVSLDLNPDAPTPVLRPGARFRVRGRTDAPAGLVFGLATRHLRGGFAGKHRAYRPPESFDAEGGDFDFVFDIAEFGPDEKGHPQSAVGLGLTNLWCLTVNEDVGLEITSAELLEAAGG